MTPRREDAAGAEPHNPYANWRFPSEKSEPREGSAEWYADKLEATTAALLAARREVEALRAEVGRVADKCDNDGRAPHASAKPYLALCDAAKLLRAALAATPEEKT